MPGGIDDAKWVAPIVVNIKHPKLNCGSSGEPTVTASGIRRNIMNTRISEFGFGSMVIWATLSTSAPVRNWIKLSGLRRSGAIQ